MDPWKDLRIHTLRITVLSFLLHFCLYISIYKYIYFLSRWSLKFKHILTTLHYSLPSPNIYWFWHHILHCFFIHPLTTYSEKAMAPKKWKKRNCWYQYCRNIKKTIRKYYEWLYTNKFDNLEEMDTFLETYSPPKLNQEEIDNMNKLIISKHLEKS